MRFAHRAVAVAGAASSRLAFTLPAAVAAAGQAPAPTAAGIPFAPEQLTYRPFVFDAPVGDKYRQHPAGGVVVYVVPDHSLPLVKLQATFRTGAFARARTRPASRR